MESGLPSAHDQVEELVSTLAIQPVRIWSTADQTRLEVKTRLFAIR
ncbi:hypothetical protein [Desulfogranum marinum]|nr:hypothetical protein [Desulfogranum marinum]MBM9513506.1 hypothetical protein [Desulfogranum marinum]